jgi:hypothetical protein
MGMPLFLGVHQVLVVMVSIDNRSPATSSLAVTSCGSSFKLTFSFHAYFRWFNAWPFPKRTLYTLRRMTVAQGP